MIICPSYDELIGQCLVSCNEALFYTVTCVLYYKVHCVMCIVQSVR